MGGSGRQSLTRIAAYVSGMKVFQIEITKNYRTIEFHEDIKVRDAGSFRVCVELPSLRPRMLWAMLRPWWLLSVLCGGISAAGTTRCSCCAHP